MNRARSIRSVSSRLGRSKGFAYRGLLFAVPVVLAVPLVAYFGLPKLSMSSEEDGPMMQTVQRGTFLHDVTESGSVESANNVEIRCEVESHGAGTMIIWIIPEGTYVEPAPDWQAFDPSAVFRALDKNGDGALGTSEVPAWLKPRLSSLDADVDGTVDRSEFKWESLDPDRMFYALDTNGDGNLDEDEVPPWMKPHLSSIDADGDGAIDPSEFQWESFVPERVFFALDENGDGGLHKDEIPGWMKADLAAIDTNGDGTVDRSEFKLESFDSAGVLAALDEDGDGRLDRGETPQWMKPYLWAIDTNGDGEVDRSEFGVLWEPPDLLVKLDSSSLEDKRMQQQIVCNSSEAAVIQAKNNVATARIALKEYLEGIYKQDLLKIRISISQAVEDHSRLEEYYDFSSKLALRGYVSGDQLRADEVAVNQAEDKLTLAMKEFEVLEEFSKKKKLLDLEATIKIAEARLKSEEHSHQLDVEKLDEIEEQIGKCTIRAPQAGQVVYANVSNYRGSQEIIIEEGTMIRERQAIIKLPDPSDMQVKAKINEARISAVEVGMEVSIELDAFPDRKLAGTVEKVSEYPLPSAWYTGDVKEYETTIKIDNGSFPKDEEHIMRPGMTAKVAIRVEKLDDVLTVPVQAVFEHGGKHYCVLREGEALKERKVVIGPTNDKEVVIEEGLTEGEEVVLGAALYRDDLDLPEIAPETETAGDEIAGGPAESREAKPSPGSAKPKEGAGGGARRSGMPKPAQIFKTMDKNGNGKLEGDEIAGRMKENLSATDTDGDGAVSRSEFNAAMERVMRQMRNRGGAKPGRPGGRPSGRGRPGASGAGQGTRQ